MGRFYTLLSLLLEITESEYNDKCQDKQYSLENIENRKSIEYIKKSHTWEEGGGTSQGFCFAFIDELEKRHNIDQQMTIKGSASAK